MTLPFRLFCAVLLVATSVYPLSVTAADQVLPLSQINSRLQDVGSLHFLGAIVVPPGPGKLGGLSGLAFNDQHELVALSDDFRIYQAVPQWVGGRLVGCSFKIGQRLRDSDGGVPKNRFHADSEGLVHLKEGGWLVSLERDHRILHFSDDRVVPSGVPSLYARLADFSALSANAGLESIAELKDGRILTLAEDLNSDGTHPGWLLQNGNGERLSYDSPLGLAPSDAASLPNGDVLVLERGFNLLFNFRARIVRIKKEMIEPGKTLKGDVVAVLESPLITENFEGLAVDPQNDGSVILYLVSDNNFNAAQRTILAAFRYSLE